MARAQPSLVRFNDGSEAMKIGFEIPLRIRRSPRAFAWTAVKVEVKAGTWQAEATAPGTVVIDRVKVVR